MVKELLDGLFGGGGAAAAAVDAVDATELIVGTGEWWWSAARVILFTSDANGTGTTQLVGKRPLTAVRSRMPFHWSANYEGREEETGREWTGSRE